MKYFISSLVYTCMRLLLFCEGFTMDQKLIDFINENEDLIDNNKWKDVYEKANKELANQYIGEFTKMLLDADIHPEEYLDNLPSCFLSQSKIDEFIIPSNIGEIGSYAFFDCKNLRSIIIPHDISINSGAFSESALEKISIPNTTNLKGISIFSGCSNLLEVELEEGLIEIPGTTFAECGHLSIVTIPKSVKRIGCHAFAYCGKNLTINFGGTTQEWRTLSKEVFAYTYYVAHCTNGVIRK